MEGWSGFTDEELKKLKKTPSRLDYSNEPENVKVRPNAPRAVAGGGRPMGRAGIRPSGPIQGRPPKKQVSSTVSQDMMLSHPKKQPTSSPPNERSQNSNLNAPKPDANNKESCETGSKNESKEMSENIKEIEVKEVSKKEFVQKQLSKVESYQLQQKMMEEQNKAKKKFLADAIAQKQRKAKAEASKLQHIQKELATLDQMLSCDVAIIRNHIEEASREFLEAQKRYEIAEKEFIESKIALHHANEQKEQLTEHLYTIIHQNEVRKAKKLTELMEKLELTEDSDVQDVQVELTNLMPNIVPEMSTISSFELLSRKKSHPASPESPSGDKKELPVSPSVDKNERQLNGENAVTDCGTVPDQQPQSSEKNVVEENIAQGHKPEVVSGTDASGQVTPVTQKSESHSESPSGLLSESPPVTSDANCGVLSQKDQNDNVKSAEKPT